MSGNLPNFFVIGAAKCGTTYLYELLKRHPDVYLPLVKEPRFFCNDDRFEEGLQEYVRRHYSEGTDFAARGDTSPHYLAFEKSAQRIRELIPEDGHRFIVIFRDPVDRAWSHYWNAVYEGVEPLDFTDALEAEGSRASDAELFRQGSLRHSYFSAGLFASQLETWFQYFDRSRFLFLFQEDIRSEPTAVARETFRFLGVDPEVELEAPSGRSNPAGMPASRRFHSYLRNPHWSKAALKRLLPESARYRIATKLLSLNKREFRYPELDASVAARLRDRYAADVRALTAITGRDLTAWLPT